MTNYKSYIESYQSWIWLNKVVCCYHHKYTELVQIYCIEEQMLFILIYEYSRTSIIRTSIIRISRLSRLFLWSQFGHEYLLVTIKIRSHILFKTTALKSAVKCEGFCSQRAKAAPTLVVSNEEDLNEF